MKKILREPIFYGGVALVVLAYYVTENDQTGVNNALTIAAIGAGVALVILAVRKTGTA